MGARNVLSTTFQWASEWRERLSALFPEDQRNEDAVLALQGLARWVELLPDGDPLLVRLNRLLLRYRLFHLEYLPGVQRDASRFGGFSPVHDEREFVECVLDAFKDELKEDEELVA